MDEHPDSCHQRRGLTVLGQHFDYPTNAPAVISIGIVVLSAAFVICFGIYFPKGTHEIISALSGYSITPDGPRSLGPFQTIEFWTPSADTWPSLNAMGEVSNDQRDLKQRWAYIDFNKTKNSKFGDPLTQFGNALLDTGRIKGYRHYKVVGHGSHSDSVTLEGEWWVIRTDSSYKVDDLYKTYVDFWCDNKRLMRLATYDSDAIEACQKDQLYTEISIASGDYVPQH